MKNDRRVFLKKSAAGVALAAFGGQMAFGSQSCSAQTASPTSKDQEVPLRISFQEGTAPGKSLAEKFDFMEQHGVIGFEPHGGNLASRVNEFQQELRGRNIQVSAICAGFKGFILSTEEAVRQQCIDSMKEIIAAAGELGSTGVILVPAFNSQVPVMPHTLETRDFLCEQFSVLGDFAVKHNTTIIMEPLNRKEAFYLRQVADAASLCRDIDNKGVTCLGDFWHMTFEETCDYAAFHAAGKYLQHVHMASRKRRSMPGEDGDADNYIAGFKALKELKYSHYVSFECGCQGDRATVVPAALNLLRNQWSEA